MDTKDVKKARVRADIIDAAQIYSSQLAGKIFLYVTGDDIFEVAFKTDRFMHLTGTTSHLRAQVFYDKAKSAELTDAQFGFAPQHGYKSAKKKLACLKRLPELTNSHVCVIKDMLTLSLTYQLGVTNIDFTIGLTENLDVDGNKINDWFLPRTLRVKDNALTRGADYSYVNYIFSKDASLGQYTTLEFVAEDKKEYDELGALVLDGIPEHIKDRLAHDISVSPTV